MFDLTKIVKFYQSKPFNALVKEQELEKAQLRIFVTCALIVYLNFIHEPGPNYDEFYACILSVVGFIIPFVIYFFALRSDKNTSVYTIEFRKLISIWSDVLAITFLLALTDHAGLFLCIFYLWEILGNGLRYGSKYLIHSQILSLFCFSYLVLHNSYWQQHREYGYAFIFALTSLPLYVSILVDRLSKTTKDAMDSNHKKTNFLAMVSHEIRTPLNGIIGISRLLRTELNPARSKRLIDDLDTSSKNLLSVLNNVLALSDINKNIDEIVIENHKIEDHYFSLQQMEKSIRSNFYAIAKSKGISFYTDFEKNGLVYKGDEQKIHHIVNNLISNAVKFTINGSVEIKTTSIPFSDNYRLLVFSIKDTGIGIPKERHEVIFDDFMQADSSIHSEFGGSGLGLSIANKISSSIGGSISFDSAVGVGSTFNFSIMLNYKDLEIGEAKPQKSKSLLKRRKINILICDDNRINNDILLNLLEPTEHNITSTSTAEEMIESLNSNQYDLVITDLNLGALSGVDAIAHYKTNHPEDKSTKFALLTAATSTDKLDRYLNYGFDYLMSKPIDLPYIYGAICDVDMSGEEGLNYYLSLSTDNSMGNIFDDSSNGFDPETISSILLTIGKGKRKAFAKKLLDSYFNEAKNLFNEIKINAEQENFSKLKANIHSLRGNSLSVGAENVFLLLDPIEKIIENNESFVINKIVNDLNVIEETIEQAEMDASVFINNLDD